jgi:hypothetical protein
MLNKVIFEILEEQSVLKTTKTKPIVDAIKNRKKITFYYSGPRKPKKDSVKPGYRVKAEAVALGLSKKGNLVMRAYVQPPSTSKKGFAEHGWRTFILNRMSGTEITDEIFNEKRPGYKEGNDNGLSVTYVTTDWTSKSDVKKPRIVKQKTTTEPTRQVEPSIEKPDVKGEKPEPQTEPKTTELPQPKPEVNPTKEPDQSPEEPNQDLKDKQKELYNKKQSEWINKQKEIGGNIKPGQGTRARFSKEVEKEIPQPKPEEKPSVNPEDNNDEDKNLQENIKRIKSLMLF